MKTSFLSAPSSSFLSPLPYLTGANITSFFVLWLRRRRIGACAAASSFSLYPDILSSKWEKRWREGGRKLCTPGVSVGGDSRPQGPRTERRQQLGRNADRKKSPAKNCPLALLDQSRGRRLKRGREPTLLPPKRGRERRDKEHSKGISLTFPSSDSTVHCCTRPQTKRIRAIYAEK